MYNQVITLLKKQSSEKVPGQGKTSSYRRKDVLAKLISIGQQEFYQSQASGLKPELKFELADYLDYENEKELVFEGVKYEVLRTYRKGTALEITVYGGVNIGTT